MSNAVQHRRSCAPASEAGAVDRVIERLIEQFPELSREEIIDAVRGHYADYDDSPVRDFLPILVERRARAELASGAAPRYRA